MSKGYLIFADQGKHDYVKMAYALALSIKNTQDIINTVAVGVPKGMDIPEKYLQVFDHVVEIPEHSSENPFYKQCLFYDATPFDETVILDADMIFTSSVDSWWDAMKSMEFCSANKVQTFRGEVITSDHCRLAFTRNDLPNCYIAFTYFKKGDTAKSIFDMMKNIYNYWEDFSVEFMENTRPENIDGDVSMSLAIKILGLSSEVFHPSVDAPTFVHMKSPLQFPLNEANIYDNWAASLTSKLTKKGDVLVGHFKQRIPFHYIEKEWMDDRKIKILERIYKKRKL